MSLEVEAGRIVELGGLDGECQRELLLALFGMLRGVRGRIEANGRPARLPSPRAAMRIGLALVPEDRKAEGLMLPLSIRHDLSAAALGRRLPGPVIDARAERALVEEMVKALQVKAGHLDDPVSSLSGGNQQKIVIAKWLATEPKIILLNDPTRGIDVGTKA